MSKQITVNGKIFEPSAILARRFGYSLDYVSRLAREGKVEATRVGRQWFVDADSLRHFVDEAAIKKSQTREQLREERKREHESYLSQTAGQKTEPEVSHKSTTSQVSEIVIPRKVVRPRQGTSYLDVAVAAVGSFLVVAAGVLAGIGLNSDDFLALVTPDVVEHVRGNAAAGALGAWRKSESVRESVSDIRLVEEAVAPHTRSGVVVFEESVSEQRLEEVRSAFSDEVDVLFESDDSGVITPVFRDTTGDQYQFLMVPVRDSS